MLPFPKTLLLIALLTYTAQGVINKDFKRRDGFDTYGPPPRPAPQYGPPPQPPRIPHREYGVPQQIPFREYGPPSLKYGPPKFINSGGFSNNNFGGGLHEQIKSHFGVPKPFYGPPHIPHKPAGSYGPPPSQPQAQYGLPPQPQAQYGPPPQPQAQYGPPPHRPSSSYGPPRPAPQYGPPPQPLPSPHPAPIFKPPHQPATSYGPPPSGPINLPPRPVYGPPPPNYGPPTLPQNVPGPQRPPPFNRVPETTVILTSGGGGHSGHFGGGQGGHFGGDGGPVKQVQIQIDAGGHTHSISGSQAPFHTACDGWKPIPAPVGAYVEQNHIDTQGGYSHVQQGFGTQYNAGGSTSTIISGSSGNGGSIIDGLSDEQLVAIALQSDNYDGPATGPGPLPLPAPAPAPLPLPDLPPTGPSDDHSLNSIENEAVQVALGITDDSYNRPPPDSFAPGSIHAQKFNGGGSINSDFGGTYLPPPPPPPSGSFVQHHHHHHHQQQAGLALQYGSQSGNTVPFPPNNIPPPSRPVSFRPPVPQGLLESIGTSVQHLDQFGVNPQAQPDNTYIPPATNDIAITGPGNLGPEYGAPQIIIEQQLPQPQPAPQFIGGQQHGGNVGNQYGPPQQQYLPPPPPPNRPIPSPPQYLPPSSNGGALFQQQSFEHAYSASQHNQQFVHAQGLPLQQEPRFNHVVHDCGQGPNLVGAGYQLQQQQSQQHQQQFTSATSGNAYNAITQSIPIAESHQQFIAGSQDSYGPPASGNDIDHEGYASQKNSVSTLPDGSDPNNLPGLDGLNVISAQKSQSIHISQENIDAQKQRAATNQPKYQLQIGPSGTQQVRNEDGANHEEILSQGLLQTILTAIEQPSNSNKEVQPAPNHRYDARAQSRADTELHDDDDGDTTSDINENEENEPAVAESNKIETKVAINDDDEEPAIVKELKPIVAADVDGDEQDELDAKH